MNALPILYSFRRCPYAMRARMAVAVSGVEVELREVVLREKPLELLEVSPKATVPVLALPDGRVIDESLNIMRWALGQNDPDGWLVHQDDELISDNDGPFKQALDRYKYPHRYGLAEGTTHREVALTHLNTLEALLVPSPYLGGATAAFTDIALFPFVRQFAATDADWFADQPLPAMRKWLHTLCDSRLFGLAMTRYPQWQTGDEITRFP